MKKIYIVLTHTGTALSKLIKKWTNDEFSHVSIALDEDLEDMFSFGRLNPYNPIMAGLVREKQNAGTFKRFKDTRAEIYAINVTESQYITIRSTIFEMYRNRKDFKFNILGLLAVGFKKSVNMENHFYCAEFVKYVLDKANVRLGLPDKLVRPEDFKYIENKELVYYGLFRKFNKVSDVKLYLEQLGYKIANNHLIKTEATREN